MTKRRIRPAKDVPRPAAGVKVAEAPVKCRCGFRAPNKSQD